MLDPDIRLLCQIADIKGKLLSELRPNMFGTPPGFVGDEEMTLMLIYYNEKARKEMVSQGN